MMVIDPLSGQVLVNCAILCSFYEISVKSWNSKITLGAQGELLN